MMKNKLKESVDFLERNGVSSAEVGIVLGTGLGDLVSHISIEKEINYSDIPHFPVPTMEHQKGRLLYGKLEGSTVVILEGRFHAYEGLSYFEITYPIRVLGQIGINYLVLSNAAGAINQNFNKGELMLVNDHINLQGGSPLAEKGMAEFGNRFVDMSEPYDHNLMKNCRQIARENNLSLHQGVYAAVVGPQLETKAEYRYLKIIGADAVGMSTVPEVIIANQLQIPCIVISVLTDVCDPNNLQPIDIDDIMAMAKKAEKSLIVLIKKLISRK